MNVYKAYVYVDESAVQRIDFRLISTTITYNNQRRATYAYTVYIGIYGGGEITGAIISSWGPEYSLIKELASVFNGGREVEDATS